MLDTVSGNHVSNTCMRHANHAEAEDHLHRTLSLSQFMAHTITISCVVVLRMGLLWFAAHDRPTLTAAALSHTSMSLSSLLPSCAARNQCHSYHPSTHQCHSSPHPCHSYHPPHLLCC
jgi:hypothetical protein